MSNWRRRPRCGIELAVLSAIEKAVAILDRLAAILCYGAALVIGTMGAIMGALSYPDSGTLGGHEFTLMLAGLAALLGFVFDLAGRQMRAGGRWRWLIQLTPAPAYFVGFTLTLCLSGSTVLLTDDVAICGEPSAPTAPSGERAPEAVGGS